MSNFNVNDPLNYVVEWAMISAQLWFFLIWCSNVTSKLPRNVEQVMTQTDLQTGAASSASRSDNIEQQVC
jgi:hypothetical protein